MNKLVTAFLCTALVVSLGCTNQNKSAPGGPGAPGSRSAAGSKETFTISPPAGTVEIKQGHSREITITVNRGKDFKQNVKLSLSTDAKGLTITPETSELKASDTSTSLKFTLDAAKDAATGEHKVTIKGSPETGTATETSFNVKITS